ncbi:caspase-6-like [Colossoma macropomum]|uniref:caspase-6-like n=1 Tax=Colossoma macropomum TaxID=42526 RepID=UPI001864B002|nr:caspase-6-like [Colossoma macropomum]
MASKEKASDLLPEYKMDYKRRGTALIFNQERFFWQLNLRERRGTATDKIQLYVLFQQLGFNVQAFDDLTKNDMMDKLRKAAKADHRDADSFVCIFLSHGEDGHVFAHDDKVDIKEITALFRGDQCESLVGKPKIFIFQACRGDITDNAVTGMALDEMPSEVEEDAAGVYTLPAGADFLMCYCVAEGFAAFRHTTLGSFYIQDLCKTLQQQGSTLEFTELLTLVNLKVSRRTHRIKKQMPCFTSMLTRKLYFKPKKE